MTAFAAKLALLVALADPQVGSTRAAEVASDITEAAGEDLSEAVLLVVTEQGESSFRREVESCKVTGDNGQAFSAFQLHREHFGHHTRSEICRDPVLAAELAQRALSGDGSIAERIGRFMGRKPTDKEVQRRASLYDRLMQEAYGGAS